MMLEEYLSFQDQNINQHFNLIRLNKTNAQKIHQTLEQLMKLITKTLELRNIFFFNQSGPEILYILSIQYDLQKSLEDTWKDIKKLLNPFDVSLKFRNYVQQLSKLSEHFMDIVGKDIAELDEINLKSAGYTYYQKYISILAAKELLDFLISQRKNMVKYNETNAGITHFSLHYQNKLCHLTQNKIEEPKQLVKKWQLLQQQLTKLIQKFTQQSQNENQRASCMHIFLNVLIIIFLVSFPLFIFLLATYNRYSELTQHWRLWTSSGSYLVYRWVRTAIYQYSLSNRLDPNISFMCNNKQQACFKSSKFVWSTLLVETTLFLWLFMAYLFFQPTQFLPMTANCLAVLCFCFEVAYGIYHMEIIEALMFKCSFYEFAAMFPIVSEVVFNSGFFLLFEAECSRNNVFQKLVYLIGTLSIVLIRLSYFYHRAEGGQKMSKLREQIQQKRKQQRQLKNQIKELSRNRLQQIPNRQDNIVMGQQNMVDSRHDLQINPINTGTLPTNSQKLKNLTQNLAQLQKNLNELCSQLRLQQKFGVFYFIVFLTQIGFLFDQTTAILVIDIIFIAICLAFFARNRILFMFDLLKIRFKINDQIEKYIFNKSTIKLGIQSIGLIVCLLSSISFTFGVHNCYFQSLHWWKKYILQTINLLIYITQSIVIIHSARDSIRYPLSGLININRLNKLYENPSKLTNGIEIMKVELQKRDFKVSFEEDRKNIVDLQGTLSVFEESKRKIKIIYDKLSNDFRQTGFQP